MEYDIPGPPLYCLSDRFQSSQADNIQEPWGLAPVLFGLLSTLVRRHLLASLTFKLELWCLAKSAPGCCLCPPAIRISNGQLACSSQS